ncbi:MAG: MFS transporter [Pseudonocardiaceae bacterium]|nr:MFS transporter [Pseudonocardiaceae bacterium]
MSTAPSARTVPNYYGLWWWLMLGWLASALDRTVTGPVITYMIDNEVSLFQGADNPHAVGGLVGSLLFAGYALMQFPGGFVGDKVGHRTVIVVSIVSAGVATVLTGLATGLVVLVAMRVLTGVGAGMFYSNDRSVIAQQTPLEKRSLGMGIVITGLALGITLAYLLASPLISLGTSWFGADNGWRMPFLFSGVLAAGIGLGMHWFFRRQPEEFRFKPAYPAALKRLSGYGLVFLVVIMLVYVIATEAGLPEWAVALVITAVALGLVALVFSRLGSEIRPVLYNRNLVLIYVAFIPILWNLWFFSFWSVSIVADAASGSTFLEAALTAVFFGVAGILGFPAGGWLADYTKRHGRGRKGVLVLCTFVQGVLTLLFTIYLVNGGQSLFVLGALIFVASLAFNALQPQAQALAADLTTPAHLGSMFGMMNLIGEIGAILSPAISGMLRDNTGNWHSAVILDTVLIFAGLVLLLFIKEKQRGRADVEVG